MKNKTVMVICSGQFVSFAECLSKSFKKVYYFKQWQMNGFPSTNDAFVGYGYNIECVESPFDHFDDIDCYIFTDLYNTGLQKHLISLGKNVFGSRGAEDFETDRFKFRKVLDKLNLPTAGCKMITGIDKLEAHLKTVKNKYVKISKFRSLHETWRHISYDHSKVIIEDIRNKAGNLADLVDFIVEDTIDSIIEIGYDGFIIDGKYPKNSMFGFELKDTCYMGKILQYDELPKVVKDINAKCAPYFKDYRMIYSNEIRMADKKTGYLTDPSCRLPAPPSECYQNVITNLAEIIYYGSQGELIEPKYADKYFGEMIIISDLLEVGLEQCLEIPKDIEPFVKLRYSYKKDGKYYCIPTLNMPEVGAVVAIGNSPEQVVERLKEYCSKIVCYGVKFKLEKLDKAIEQLDELYKIGIDF
jgi:hypothetical protein